MIETTIDDLDNLDNVDNHVRSLNPIAEEEASDSEAEARVDAEKEEDDDEDVGGADTPKLYFTQKPFHEAVHPDVQKVFKLPQYKQRTPEWYDARELCITASSMAAALLQIPDVLDYYFACFPQADLKPKPDKSCAFKDTELDLIMNKCGLGDGFKGNEFTAWGQKYEDVVSNIYAQMNQVDVLEFGLLRHQKYPFVGASPDGIVAWPLSDGSIPMLEIKCPPSRACKDHPPVYYFIQTLIQMACVDHDSIAVTDYFDANFVQFYDIPAWEIAADQWERDNPDAKHHIYGIVLDHEALDETNGEIVLQHIYPPPTIRTKDEFLMWADIREEDDAKSEEMIKYRRTYYKLDRYFISRVPASREWFLRNLPAIEKVWNKILYGRTPEGHAELLKTKHDMETARDTKREKSAANKIKKSPAVQDEQITAYNETPEECLF